MTTAPEEEDRLPVISQTQAKRRAAQQNVTTAPEEDHRLAVISHTPARRRAAQQNVTTAPEEEERLPPISHTQARHRDAQQITTTAPEEEDCLAVISHTQARRRAAQQNVTTAPEEEDRLTVTSHTQAGHRTAQQTITAEPEEEERLTVTPLAEHGNNLAPEKEGGDSQSPGKLGAQDCIKESHLCAGATTPASASAAAAAPAAAAAAADSPKGILTNDAHSLSDHPRQSHPASDQSKPQSPSKPSSALAKQDSDTNYSMPTNNRLQHDGDGRRTDQEGASAILQSSPESVHEPLLITSKRQVLPLSWSKACRTPGSPSMAQVSRRVFVVYFAS